MFRCILQATDGTYYRYGGNPTTDIQEALCFESRYDADWDRDNEPHFKGGKVIPVILLEDGSILPFPTQYLVVSYKPDHSDYVRNCFMGHYDSKHEMKVFTSEDDIVEHIAKLEADTEGLDTYWRHWVMTQDELFGGYEWCLNSSDHMPLHLKDRVKARVKELKGKK